MEFVKTCISASIGSPYTCEQVYRACTILKNEKYHHQ
ncbi:23S rRNA (pseudouridine(1915)-N(3))-methyltransferase RlmH [Niabella ginsengisoli]|uniref:23S rRNA (Pseudouridine(1915)-N(3))-methyltransferase RlmH n=1 Tax=Niabella ginsengisoli TaxID=522298 RepID=A0ABS9SRD5_9BACT|nr:23S rRNA (pseudouridine(1915)-N(3))-methyltransferase RlmH [Niabella ginsengisoli]MCH5600944.1 23S rRNA (pseudouridine(1915)-N(3))-methyltransferase RlmH [Niabella ginsengisoli]